MAAKKKRQKGKDGQSLSSWRFDQSMLRRFRSWRVGLRDYKTYNYIPLSYQRYDFVPGETRVPGTKQFKIFNLGDPKPPWEKDREPRSASKPKWLKEQMLQFLTEPNNSRFASNWKGVRMLGEGGEGKVGLWRFDGPTINNPLPQFIAIKEAKYPGNLNDEVEFQKELMKCKTEHVLLPLQPPIKDQVDNGRYIIEKYMVLILEFCEMGDLRSLIERRRRMSKRFTELSLWRFFDCLVDGSTVLGYGAEYKFDTDLRQHVQEFENPPKDWTAIGHLDFKPSNIMVAEPKKGHQIPILKESPLRCGIHIVTLTNKEQVGDFGHSFWMPPRSDNDDEEELASYKRNLDRMRRAGTPGFRIPEQTSEQWGYKNWYDLGLPGYYGPWSNLWSVGYIMYLLLTLEKPRQDPEGYPRQPALFWPDFPINGESAKCHTYCENLLAYNEMYSEELRHLIFECLYERPEHRPSFYKVKKRIAVGLIHAYDAAKDAGESTVEPLSSFQHGHPPEPESDESTATLAMAIPSNQQVKPDSFSSRSRPLIERGMKDKPFDNSKNQPSLHRRRLGSGKEIPDSQEPSSMTIFNEGSEELPAPYPLKPKKDISDDWVVGSDKPAIAGPKRTKRGRSRSKDGEGPGGDFTSYRDNKSQKTESSRTRASCRSKRTIESIRNEASVKFADPPPGTSGYRANNRGTQSKLRTELQKLTVQEPQRKTVVARNRRTPKTTSRTTSKKQPESPLTPRTQVRRAFERRIGANTEIIFHVYHLDGPPGQERAIGVSPFTVGHLNSTATVLDLKKQIRLATKEDENSLEVDQIYLQITSLPNKLVNLEGSDDTTFAEFGINGLTYPHITVAMRNRPGGEKAVKSRFPFGLDINVDVRDARSDRWILEFKGLEETMRLRNLKQRVHSLTKVPVASQVWYYANKQLGFAERGMQLRELVERGGDTFIVVVKDEKIFVDYQIPDVEVPYLKMTGDRGRNERSGRRTRVPPKATNNPKDTSPSFLARMKKLMFQS